MPVSAVWTRAAASLGCQKDAEKSSIEEGPHLYRGGVTHTPSDGHANLGACDQPRVKVPFSVDHYNNDQLC